jgi:glycosyltransferase involved in cell wall biosynthesis
MAARSARVFYCLSQDMADGVIAAGVVSPSKVRVIRNGIETALYRRSNASRPIRQSLGIPDGAPLIGTVGRLNEIKRQDLLMEAFDIVLQSYPDAHLLLVGDGPQRRLLEERAAGTSRPERIHFAGYQADTTPYLHAMDLFALPSRSEGMPQALLEACVAEKPVIASRVGGIPEVIEHEVTGILVEPGSAPTLATGIRRLLADPSLSAQMALRASAKVVAMFDVSRMAREYHRDFLDLLRMPPKGVDLLTDVN